ncbi:Serine/threonine-protein phosphatase 4 regulatory subunit 3 [Auxenochlorella protothecoides]|uniref:Serine/threonine-protein phosphatase 4 regulatory subunit 3 n=1 Tax=Auxenochlorella protothecoides TaxID=3075 RepID=A0A087SMA8_AUXPR|nr:Serine/threonine-protein phosphatase 4 regulatory subunit 3 [Auxenochlorella protothecoides]KFM26862.1 Serine/threonine-protein phosphatase 4 regulatory subunit 3 [Auxenochlorella protothecoides]
MQRVRVYHLNENGHWDDKGTGVIKVETAEVRHALGIRCRAPWAGDQGDGSSVCTLKLVCTSASPRPHRRPMLPPQHPTSDVHLIIEDDTDASRLLNHTVTQGTSYQRQKGARLGMYGCAGRSEGCRHVRRPPVHPCMWLGCCDRGQCDCGWHTSVQTLFVRAAFASYKQLLQRRPAPHSADDSIISWTEASSGIEIALSFQEAFTCTQVWAEIQSVQDAGLSPRAQAAKLQESAGLMHGPHLPLGPGQSPAGQDPPPETGPFPAHGADLPAAELGNLPAIARSLSEASVFQRERLVHQLSAPGYLGRLVGLFRVCEDLEEEESLAQLHVALRAAIMLNDAGLIEALLSEPLVMDVVGALEYEPGVAPAARPRHREWLRDRAHLREPVPIADPGVRAKIHDTYRLGYVRDVVMPRFLDDAVLATLRSLALFNSVEVLMALAADAHAFPALFDKLRGAKPGGGDWADGVGFLQELASLAKHLQASQRTTLFGKLADLGLFEVMIRVLELGEPELHLRATDILLSFMHGRGCGMQEQVLELLRILLDPDTMDASVERDAFIDSFYEAHAGTLVGALVAATRGGGVAAESAGAADTGDAPTTSAHTLGLIVELLCYCVTQHSYRIKYYILRNNVVEKVLRLLHRKERWLVVAAIRFLRTCLGMKDEFYNRYLVKNGLLEPVIAVFLENGNRYNLLNSVVLELFEFMWRENMKGLLGYVVESPRWPELQALDFAPTFRRLSMKHDQNQVVCRLRQEVLCTWAACPIPGCGWALSLGHCSKKLTFVTSHQQERSTGSAAAPAGSGPGSEAGGGVFLGHARAAAAAQQRRIREWGQGEGEGER